MIALLCNPLKGHKSASLVTKLTGWLDTNGIVYAKFYQWPELDHGFKAAWVIGGDGTLNYFVNRYPNCGIPFTIFAGGTGNDFRWMVYGEMTWEEQASMAIRGKFRKIDAGLCNDRLFINGLGIGFDGAIVRSLGGSAKKLGKLAYLMAVVKGLMSWQSVNVVISRELTTRSVKAFMISLANASRYGGGFLVAPRASVVDGALDMIIVEALPVWKRLVYLPKIMKGKHLGLAIIKTSLETEIRVSSKLLLPAHLDGELMLSNTFNVKVLPQHFKLLVPGS